jgi:hypothetical protein
LGSGKNERESGCGKRGLDECLSSVRLLSTALHKREREKKAKLLLGKQRLVK